MVPVTAPECEHVWAETYYGYECARCGLFYAFGCAPWEDGPWVDEDYDGDDDDYASDCLEDELEEAMQNCGQLLDGTCMKAGSEECDWECPFST